MQNSRNLIRILGIVAIIGAILSTIAETCIFYLPGEGIEFNEYTLLQNVPQSRLIIGHYLGVLSFPLQLLGFWQIYQALKPAGKWFSLSVFLLISYSWICGIAAYGSFAYMSTALQTEIAATEGDRTLLIQMIDTLKIYHEPLYYVLLLGLVFSWVWYSVSVAFRSTLYPRWMAILNPFLMSIIVLFIGGKIPMISRFIGAAFYNIAIIIFFSISTIVLWNSQGKDLQVN
ncbi:hypothetical protein HC931_08155 [Candidatus Gracilibacteria bacterium]|nr:hypothetical protein [Candidatus Gracilibacteria bacterium]NJM87083.1 hypothetical protein [Hydrococcus sp. RU_2_2]NJP19817.1 hypothetical protein [Hydrococcus sp. CRU_1_1]